MKAKDILISMFWTTLILIGLDIFSSVILIAFGINNFHLAFEILIILFLGLRVNHPLLPVFILVLMFFHGAFSTDGWEISTTVGVLVCLLLNYLRDLIQISGKRSTMVTVQIFQLAWFVVIALIISLKNNDFSYYYTKFPRFLAESILMSLIAPYFFYFMSKIWKKHTELDSEGVDG